MTATPLPDPLQSLRAYRGLAPWNLRDLSLLVGAVLEASSVTPINAAARARPSERTIRFYVSRGLVSPPDGRGTAATYSYRHFLQLLCVKVRQMEGATLEAITQDMRDLTGDVLERRAAQALGAGLPAPDRLALRGAGGLPRGRSGRGPPPPPSTGESGMTLRFPSSPVPPPNFVAFKTRLASVTRLTVDGGEVGRVVGAALADRSEVVYLVGPSQSAPVAAVVVPLEDPLPQLPPLGGGGTRVALPHHRCSSLAL